MNVTLIGASGFVGSAILKELLDRGVNVTAVVRDTKKVTLTNPALKVVSANVADEAQLIPLCEGKDAVISAYNPGWGNPRQYEETLENYPKIVDAVKKAGVKRLLIVGGAGTLFVKPGLRLVDAGVLPAEWMPGVKSLGEFYLNDLMKEKDIDWIFFSPAGNLAPGERTGNYRLGKDDLIVDAEGNSNISVQDYAKAMVDELLAPAHHQERFTIGY